MSKPFKILLGVGAAYMIWRYFLKEKDEPKQTQTTQNEDLTKKPVKPMDLVNNPNLKNEVASLVKVVKERTLTDEQIFDITEEFRLLQHGKSSYAAIMPLLKDATEVDFQLVVDKIKERVVIHPSKGFSSFSDMVYKSDNELFNYLKQRFTNFR